MGLARRVRGVQLGDIVIPFPPVLPNESLSGYSLGTGPREKRGDSEETRQEFPQGSILLEAMPESSIFIGLSTSWGHHLYPPGGRQEVQWDGNPTEMEL